MLPFLSFSRWALPLCLLALLSGLHPARAESDVTATALPDVELIDQQGEPVRFYSGLIEGRVVAIQFVFTSCRVTCPLLGVQFGKLQELLGERMERDVRLLSISVDPLTDRPERLAAWAEQYHAGPGWTQLTGGRSEIETVLKALGTYTADKAEHTSFVLLIDDAHGEWKRLDGLSSPEVIAAEIGNLLAAR